MNTDNKMRSFTVTQASCVDIAEAVVTLLESTPDDNGGFGVREDALKAVLLNHGILNADDTIKDINAFDGGSGVSIDLESGETFLISVFAGPGGARFSAIGVTPANARDMGGPESNDSTDGDDELVEKALKEIEESFTGEIKRKESKHARWPFPTGDSEKLGE